MIIYILNNKLETIHVLENFIDLNFSEKHNDVGSFSLNTSLNDERTEYLKRGNLIFIPLANKTFFINNVTIKEENNKIITLSGFDLNDILTFRIIWGTLVFKENINSVLTKILNKNFIEPVSPHRRIDNLVISELEPNSTFINNQISFKECLGVFQDICNFANLSFNLSFNPELKKIEFKTRNIRNLTVDSESPVVLNKVFDNIDSFSYYEDDSKLKNSCLVAGAGEGELREFVEIGSEAGFERKELFVDARDLSNTTSQTVQTGVDSEGNPIFSNEEVTIPIDTYKEMLRERGVEKLKELELNISCDINMRDTEGSFVFGVDYNLGDYISYVNKELELLINTQVIEVNYYSTGNKINKNIILGNPIITLNNKIKKMEGR